MPDELDAIRIRLEARCTPGEWHTNEPGPYVHSVWSDNGPVRDFVATGVGPSDARFIAHAPTDIATLLSHVDRLRDLAAALEAELAEATEHLAGGRP